MDTQIDHVNGSSLLCPVCGGLMHKIKNTQAYQCSDCSKSIRMNFRETKITMLERSTSFLAIDSGYISRLSICSNSHI